ncbi:MAG: cellulose synthase, partial [Gammaproteobacteria bacterium]|nr:cellulose synthase [Gammaproteobacteria bacterium]
SQANPNVASTAQPATAFFTLLRRALLGEGDWRLRLVRQPRQAPIAGARVAVKRRSAQPAALQASSGPLGVLTQLRALMNSVW